MKKYKDFRKSIKEASIQDNPSITPEYFKSLNKRGEESASDIESKMGRSNMSMSNFINMVNRVHQIQKGKEREIESLTKQVILKYYGDILGETELEIKIPKVGERIKVNNEPGEMDPTQMELLKDIETINAIHKRKILNMISQGEALNSKKMILSEENISGLNRILGKDLCKEMVDLLIKITDISQALDWRIPIEVRREMIKMGQSFESGMSKIEWKPKKYDPNEDDQDDQDDDQEHAHDMAKLIIVGIDQSMLYHEAIKAIYGLIHQGGLSHLSEETIKTVFLNTEDVINELEDIKYGKLTASDLRDFFNTFEELDDIQNGREFIWGKLIDASLVSDKKFLEIIKDILEASPLYKKESRYVTYTSSDKEKARLSMSRVRVEIDKLIKIVKDEFKDYQRALIDYEMGHYDEESGEILKLKSSNKKISLNIDDILDKISETGMKSLTKDEIDFLNNNS